MLCQFTVTNYRCLKDETTLDLQATNITEHGESLLTDEDGEKFLPVSVIYGPNGAGKSTVLEAMYSLVCKIMRPICAISCNNTECEKRSGAFQIKPFLFSDETIARPTEFEIFFRTVKYEYQYQLSLLNDKILHEKLDKKLISGYRYTPVFSRNGTKDITVKGSLKNYDYSGISENLTLLSFFGITHSRNAIIKDIVKWFDTQFQYCNYSIPSEETSIPVAKSEKAKILILQMMQEMGIDISDYRTEKKDEKLKIFTSHSVNGHKYELNLLEESNGTIKVFGLLPYIAMALLHGGTIVIDELDAKLHPKLLEYIISLFSNPEKNKNKAQLIFTSHDLSTMNSSCFRRDEIWFIAKGKNQNAALYSLVEFKSDDGRIERKDLAYNKRYLEGRYGADPYLKRIINWGDY